MSESAPEPEQRQARAGTHDAIWSEPPDVFESLPGLGGNAHEEAEAVAI